MSGNNNKRASQVKEVMPAALRVRKRFVATLIGLPDNNEKALAYALGYMIANSRLLRNRLLNHALGVKKPVSSKNISIQIEKSDRKSRYDISIMIHGRLRLIIEGKIDRNKPRPIQCYNYVKGLVTNKTEGRQSLLLIYDWIEEQEMGKSVTSLRNRLDSKSRHKWGSYICEPLTWAKVQDWCESILEDKSVSLKEKQLLIDYIKYLDLERYAHGALEDLPIPKAQVSQLEYIMYGLKEIKNAYEKRFNMQLELIPPQCEDVCLYAGDGRNRGYCGYRKETKYVFGLWFEWGNKHDAYVYLVLPNGLPKALERHYHALEDCWDGKIDENMECLFDITDRDKKSIGLLLDKLEQLGFFETAVKQAM